MLLNARVLRRSPRLPARILLGIQDITDILQFQTEARKAAERFKLLFERSPLPKWLIDLDTLRFIDVNEAAIEHYGYSRDEFLQMSMFDLLAPEARAKVKAALGQPPHRPPEKETLRHCKKSGELIDVEIRANQIELDGKRAWLASINDVTELRRAEKANRDADRRKDEFLAVLAHELRGPLAPLGYALEIAKRNPKDSESVRQMGDMMRRQLGLMTRLIDDLLDVSRISRGKLELRRQEVELRDVIGQAVELSRPMIDAAEQQLTVTLPPQPLYLLADVIRLTQVFANLLNNASKFCEPKGRIWLTAEHLDGAVVVSVKDSGIGIPPDMLGRIFDMFTQVDRSKERKRGGLGIGLTLARQLVELHGGSVEALSEGAGRGSEFVVRLPCLIEGLNPETNAPSTSSPITANSRRVLVVDDNVDAANSLAMLLQMSGYQTHVAHDGIEAVEAAQTFKPDVVLLDIGLPRLNGYGAARRIREQPWGKNMLLIALTGWGQERDQQESEQAGFDAHLVKPVDTDNLMKVLAQSRPPVP
jgi:PAS domain S-box-containing protein